MSFSVGPTSGTQLIMDKNFDHWLKVESFRLSHIKSPFFPCVLGKYVGGSPSPLCECLVSSSIVAPLNLTILEVRLWQAVIAFNGSILTGSFRSLYSCAQSP